MTEDRRDARERKTDKTLIARASANGIGQWLLVLYRGGTLTAMAAAVWIVAQAWATLDDVKKMDLAPALARIEANLQSLNFRIASVERWVEGENDIRRPER